MSKEEKIVEVTESYLKYLENKERKLTALEECGVDNWCGYGDAMQIYHQEMKK